MSHSRTVLSHDTLASTDWTGLKHKLLTGPSWPLSTCSSSKELQRTQLHIKWCLHWNYYSWLKWKMMDPLGQKANLKPNFKFISSIQPLQQFIPFVDKLIIYIQKPRILHIALITWSETSTLIQWYLTSSSRPVCMDHRKISKESWEPAHTNSPLLSTAREENWAGRGDVMVRKFRYLRKQNENRVRIKSIQQCRMCIGNILLKLYFYK